MDKVELIYNKLFEFIQIFIVKYQYENRGLLRKLRIDSRLNMDIEDERWGQLFLYKSCFNHCAKFVILKLLEDLGQINMKTNEIGIKKWRYFVKNLGKSYDVLYEIAIKDLQADSNNTIREIFKSSDYDLFIIDRELASCLIDQFENLLFSDLTAQDISLLFKMIYSLEQREEMNLIHFYKIAPALEYILSEKKLNAIF